MWSYNKDMERLSDKAVEEAISTCMRFNSFMSFNDESIGAKDGLKNTVDFLEICQDKFNKEIDKKIKDIKERI